MKKLILTVLFIFFISSQSFASPMFDVGVASNIQDRMDRVGYRILNSNRIEKRVVFRYTPTVKVYNVGTDIKYMYVKRSVYVTPLQMSYVSDDDELAAILSRRIAQAVDSYDGIFRGYGAALNYWVKPQKYNNKADKVAVDYMVNAGYNPLALIVMISKEVPQRRYEYYDSYSLTTKRMAKIYEYIYTKYPAFLANNEYSDNIYYQNFLLTSRANRAKLQKSIESKSKKKVNYK